MMKIRKLLLIAVLLSPGIICFSQDSDFGIWAELTARHDFTKKHETELTASIRTFHNSSIIEQKFLEGTVRYDFSTHISAAASYRLASMYEGEAGYFYRHKIFVDVKAAVPLNDLSLSARLRLQRTTKTYIKDEDDLDARYVGRMRMQASYSLKSFPVKPYVYYEMFSPVFSGESIALSKYRLSAGADLKITQKLGLEAGYIFQRDRTPVISDEHILSVSCTIKF